MVGVLWDEVERDEREKAMVVSWVVLWVKANGWLCCGLRAMG